MGTDGRYYRMCDSKGYSIYDRRELTSITVLTGEEIVATELWIDENGLAHSQIHTSNKATFQYTKAALEAFVKQLQ